MEQEVKVNYLIDLSQTFIDYIYDPLYRLEQANYSNNDYYHYTYDAVGNRLQQITMVGGLSSTVNYVPDDANRLASVNGVNYTWDNNGNLLNDGVNIYTYDSANHLKQLTQGTNTYIFSYNGLGDRLAQNGVHYTLDLNAGLTQVLSDGTDTYLYGLDRVAQQQSSASEYYLGDALGSVRQVVNSNGTVALARSYDPYGNTRQTIGDAQTNFGFTGEFTDPSGLAYLRARYYDPRMGRFLTRDPSGAEANLYQYARANPVNRIDPTGLFSRDQVAKSFGFNNFSNVLSYYDAHGEHWGFLATLLRALPGDYIISEQFRIEPFTKPYKRAKAFYVGYDAGQGITLNGRPLRTTFALNSSENPTKGQIGTLPWRSSDAIYYTVKDDTYSRKEEYVDSPLKTDIPDFWAISGSLAIVQGMYMVDRFGHKYFTGGVTISTSDVGVAYVEGYVGVPYSNDIHHYVPEQELYEHLGSWSGCFSGEISIIIGISGELCLNQTLVGMYSLGLQLTAGGGFAPYTWDLGRDASLGWNWIIEDMKTGIRREDLSTIFANYFDGCNDKFPHLGLPSIGN